MSEEAMIILGDDDGSTRTRLAQVLLRLAAEIGPRRWLGVEIEMFDAAVEGQQIRIEADGWNIHLFGPADVIARIDAAVAAEPYEAPPEPEPEPPKPPGILHRLGWLLGFSFAVLYVGVRGVKRLFWRSIR